MAKGIAGTDRDSALVSIEPETGYIRAMAVVAPSAVQPRRAGQAPAGLDVQDDGADDRAAPRRRPNDHELHVDAAEVHRRQVGADRRQDLRRAPTRGRVEPRQRDAEVRQHASTSSSISTSARRRSSRPPTTWASRRSSTATRPRASAGCELGVSPLEMARAYATIASGGYRIRPTSVTKVVVPRRPQRDAVPAAEGRRSSATASPTRRRRSCSRTSSRARARRPTSTARRPARPARPTTSPTPGSSATRRSCRRRSGSATPTRANPMPGAAGGAAAAPIWGAYMGTAKGGYCGDFARRPSRSGRAVHRPVFALRRWGETGIRRRRRRTAPASPRTTAGAADDRRQRRGEHAAGDGPIDAGAGERRRTPQSSRPQTPSDDGRRRADAAVPTPGTSRRRHGRGRRSRRDHRGPDHVQGQAHTTTRSGTARCDASGGASCPRSRGVDEPST